MKINQGHPVFVVFLVITTVGLLGMAVLVRGRVQAKLAEADPGVGEDSATPVGVTRVQRRIIRVQADFHGFLEEFTGLTLAAQVSGEIAEQNVEIDDDVRRGEQLFKIDGEALAFSLAGALALKDKAQEDLNLAKANKDKMAGLPREQSAAIERMEAKTQHLAAEAELRRVQALVKEARLILEHAAVVSPIDGVVSNIHHRKGEFATRGQPLVDVIEIDRLKLRVQVDDLDVVWMDRGQDAVLTAKMFPGETFVGTIFRIHPKAVPTSRKFEVEIELPNPGRRLRPGFMMQGTITRPAQEGEDAPGAGVLIVPIEAVIEPFGQHSCYVIRPEGSDIEPGGVYTATQTAIEVLAILSDPRHYQVTSGLSEGDWVVTKGIQHLSDQTTVRIIN